MNYLSEFLDGEFVEVGTTPKRYLAKLFSEGTQPMIEIHHEPSSNIRLTIRGNTARNYVLQESPDLKNWADVRTWQVENETTEITLPEPSIQHFYRVIQ